MGWGHLSQFHSVSSPEKKVALQHLEPAPHSPSLPPPPKKTIHNFLTFFKEQSLIYFGIRESSIKFFFLGNLFIFNFFLSNKEDLSFILHKTYS